LSRLFANWHNLAPEYRTATPVADGYVTEIRYGEKAVVVYDGAKDVPELFNQAREKLETTARQLRAAK